MLTKRLGGTEALEEAKAGAIESSQGSAIEAPAPLRKERLETDLEKLK